MIMMDRKTFLNKLIYTSLMDEINKQAISLDNKDLIFSHFDF
jgi:hypothetical protein